MSDIRSGAENPEDSLIPRSSDYASHRSQPPRSAHSSDSGTLCDRVSSVHPAVVAALARVRLSSPAQVRSLVTAVAQIQPGLLVELADRADLDSDLREHLVREAPPYLVVELLESWAPDPGLVRAVVEAHGALPELVVLCGARGWMELAAELAAHVEWTRVRSLPARWSKAVDVELPPSVQSALVEAALTEREPSPDLASTNDWERREALDRLRQEQTERDQVAWSLLEGHPQQWASWARAGEHAPRIQRILLDHADELADEVLVTCVPEVVGERLPDMKVLQGVRLSMAARYVRRWPRLREVAAEELRGLVTEVTGGDWKPVDRYSGPDWNGIAALAELSDDTQLLTDTVAAVRNAEPSTYETRDRQRLERWHDERAAAVAALTTNPHVPRTELIAWLPTLDEKALGAILQHSEGELRSACAAQASRLRQVAEEQRPKMIEVPNDDELAEHDDPTAVLRTHLKNLKARAAQRDVTIDGLLRSRFTTPEILQALPAVRVLDAAEHAAQVAELLAEACGQDQQCWSALPGLSDPPPARTITFGAWLDHLRTPQPRESSR